MILTPELLLLWEMVRIWARTLAQHLFRHITLRTRMPAPVSLVQHCKILKLDTEQPGGLRLTIAPIRPRHGGKDRHQTRAT